MNLQPENQYQIFFGSLGRLRSLQQKEKGYPKLNGMFYFSDVSPSANFSKIARRT